MTPVLRLLRAADDETRETEMNSAFPVCSDGCFHVCRLVLEVVGTDLQPEENSVFRFKLLRNDPSSVEKGQRSRGVQGIIAEELFLPVSVRG